jgi:hypothetical protein
MRSLAALVILIIASLLGGCDWARSVSGRINPNSVGMADRCAEIMKKAMPYADIDLGQRTSEASGVSTIVARVEGTRSDLPKDAPGDRDLAVECRFDNGVLTDFHWTKGGPPQGK